MKDPRAGRVRLDPTAFVAPGAVVIGEVSLARHSSVWFNTVVRGDVAPIEVGEGSNLQDNTTVHVDEGSPARIGNRVTVGHRSIVHGCVIEDDCLVGMGSVLLSGCRIGSGSFLGAATLVLEKMEIPPASLVLGSPARIVGTVNDRQRAAIAHGHTTYSELAQSCLRRGYGRAVGRSGELAEGGGEMTWSEWQARLSALAELPARIEADARGEAPAAWTRGRPSALEILAALRADDADVRLPCLEALRSSRETALPELPSVAPEARLEDALASWKEARAALVTALLALSPADWTRIAGHPTRGPFSIAALVRDWVDRDVERHVALARALGGGA